jgi:hypothetical protein
MFRRKDDMSTPRLGKSTYTPMFRRKDDMSTPRLGKSNGEKPSYSSNVPEKTMEKYPPPPPMFQHKDEKCPCCVWDKAMEDLDHWLKNQKTDNDLRTTLMQGIRSIQTGSPLNYHKLNLQECMDTGMEGDTTNQWQETRHSCYQAMGYGQIVKRWLIALITKLLNVSWDQWDYRNNVSGTPM